MKRKAFHTGILFLLITFPGAAFGFNQLCPLGWRLPDNFPVYIDKQSFETIDGISGNHAQTVVEKAINSWNINGGASETLLYSGETGSGQYPSYGVTVRMDVCYTGLINSSTPLAAVSYSCSNRPQVTFYQ
jgi:hypothetical protein